MAQQTNADQTQKSAGHSSGSGAKKIDAEELKRADQLVKEMEALSMKYNLMQKKQDPTDGKEFKFWKTQPVPKIGECELSKESCD